MHKARVVVAGSLVMDLVVKVARRPRKGETVVGESFGMFCGGKGFNQAVACRRLGADVAMIGHLGDDLFAPQFVAALDEEGIDARHVHIRSSRSTGVGTPVIDADGDNSIILVPGANMELDPEAVEGARDEIDAADVLLLQLEVPQPASCRAAELARASGATVILNPAPAASLDDDLLAHVDLLVPNETELEAIPGGAAGVLERYPSLRAVVVTLGEAGSLLVARGWRLEVESFPVPVVDTTGAGDAYCAGLAVALARGWPLRRALHHASAAGSLACVTLGAQPSMPTDARVAALAATRRDS